MNAPQRLNVMTRAQLIERILKLEAANAKCGETISAAVQAEREAVLSEADALEFKPSKWSDLLTYIRARNAREERKA